MRVIAGALVPRLPVEIAATAATFTQTPSRKKCSVDDKNTYSTKCTTKSNPKIDMLASRKGKRSTGKTQKLNQGVVTGANLGGNAYTVDMECDSDREYQFATRTITENGSSVPAAVGGLFVAS